MRRIGLNINALRLTALMVALIGICTISGCVTILGGAAASAVGGVATNYWHESHHEKYYHYTFDQVWQAAMVALRENNYVIVQKKNNPPEEELEVTTYDQEVWATLTFHRINKSLIRLAIYATDPYHVPDRINGAALLASIDAKLGIEQAKP